MFRTWIVYFSHSGSLCVQYLSDAFTTSEYIDIKSVVPSYSLNSGDSNHVLHKLKFSKFSGYNNSALIRYIYVPNQTFPVHICVPLHSLLVSLEHNLILKMINPLKTLNTSNRSFQYYCISLYRLCVYLLLS